MKTIKLTLAAITLALLGLNPATAQDAAKSRADVKAEAQAAVKSGVGKGEADCAPITEKSTRSRADVKAEGKAAVKSGEGKGEYDCPAPSKVSTKKRAEVKAEAKEAVSKGQVGKGEADIKK